MIDKIGSTICLLMGFIGIILNSDTNIILLLFVLSSVLDVSSRIK